MKPYYTYDQIAYQLTDIGQATFGESRQSFSAAAGAPLYYNISALNTAGKMFARAAFESWSAVSGLTFEERSYGADIAIDHGSYGDGAFANTYTVGTSQIVYAEITISRDWMTGDWTSDRFGGVSIEYDSYTFQTFIHEIGHGLGLAHAGDYNGNANFEDDAHYANDSWQATIMSYFPQSENSYIDADFAYVVTPMIADILAIQELYRIRPAAHTGDTTYGFNGNTGTYLDDLAGADEPFALTLFDTDGNDTIDLSDIIADQRIDLREEAISDIAGLTGNLAIARGVTIENAMSGAGDDTVIGNDVSNQINGAAGDDALYGQDGDDDILGGLGQDQIFGGDGNDQLTAVSGANRLNGEDGDDVLMGSFQADHLSGGAGNDVLRGDMGQGFFAGSDTLDGGTGNDLMMGAGGADTFIFRPNEGADTIAAFQMDAMVATAVDFVSGQDKVQLSSFTSMSAGNVMDYVSDDAGGAVFAAQGTQITFFGLSASDLSADDFVFA